MKMSKIMFNSNKLSRVIKQFAFVGLMSFSINASLLANTQYEELDKELEVLDSVLSTVLKQQENKSDIKFRSLDSQYLAGQGVVISVNTSGKGHRRFEVLNLPSGINVPLPPDPPNIYFNKDLHSDIHLSSAPNVEVIIKDSLGEITEFFEREEDLFRATQSEARELARVLRSVQRETRDLEFELEQADNKRKKEIKEKMSELEAKSAEHSLKRKKLQEEAEKLAIQHKQKRQERLEESREANQRFSRYFGELISENMCRFAGALRNLPKDEHISFVLENFDADLTNSKKDRIFVFKMSEINKCAQDKIKPSKLLASAKVYDF